MPSCRQSVADLKNLAKEPDMQIVFKPIRSLIIHRESAINTYLRQSVNAINLYASRVVRQAGTLTASNLLN